MGKRDRSRRRRFTWVGSALLVAVVAVVGLLTPAGTMLVSAETGTATSVFYSGEGCAGLFSAGSAARRLRAQGPPCVSSDGFGTYNGRWTSDTSSETCSSDAATFPETVDGRTFDQLVGYSLGRLGALYFLQAAPPDAKNNIDSIVLIDPGSSDLLDNRCDVSDTLDASGLLRDWLASRKTNRLTVIAGTLTQTDDYAGLKNNYLAKLADETVGAQVTVCASNTDHDEMIHKFGYLAGVKATAACPDSSDPVTIRPSTPSAITPSATTPATSVPSSPEPPTQTQPTHPETSPTLPEPVASAPATTDPGASTEQTPVTSPLGETPTFSVFHATWPDGTVGVYFRYEPQWSATTSTNNFGVYDGEQVQVFCYTEGEPVGELANTIWYSAADVSRPMAGNTPNQGYVNAHFVQDGMGANVPYPGVLHC